MEGGKETRNEGKSPLPYTPHRQTRCLPVAVCRMGDPPSGFGGGAKEGISPHTGGHFSVPHRGVSRAPTAHPSIRKRQLAPPQPAGASRLLPVSEDVPPPPSNSCLDNQFTREDFLCTFLLTCLPTCVTFKGSSLDRLDDVNRAKGCESWVGAEAHAKQVQVSLVQPSCGRVPTREDAEIGAPRELEPNPSPGQISKE